MAAACDADGYAYLAASRPGQEVAKSDQIREPAFRQPTSIFDVFLSKKADVSDGSAERGESKAQRNGKDREEVAETGSCAG